jgi:hypothetical protein
VDEGVGAARMSEGLEILINSTCKYMYYVGCMNILGATCMSSSMIQTVWTHTR